MENQTETQPPILSVGLRTGGTLELRADETAGGTLRYSGNETLTYPLAELAGASLVADTGAPPLPNGMPWPAIRLQMRNGTATVFTPMDPPEATRLLEAIYQRRPDLRVAAPPPPPGAQWGAPPPPPNYGYAGVGYAGYAPGYPPPHPSGIPSSDRTLAGLCHLSVFFAPIILPLIIWLVVRDSQPYASRQAKQAFFFHLFFSGIAFVLSMLFFFVFFAGMMSSFSSFSTSAPPDTTPFTISFVGAIIFDLIAAAFGIVNIVFSIIGAVQTFQGKPFHYPLLGNL